MRVGAVTLAFNDQDIIEGTLKCLKPFVDKHVVLISEKPYYGRPIEMDCTEDIAERYDCEVIKGAWELDHFQRSLGNEMCKDCDWVLGFDSDERITRVELEKLIEIMRKTNSQALSVCPEIYWKTTDYVLRPKPSYTPIIAMKPNVRFTHIRNIDTPWEEVDIEMHHLSWCEPKDILKKVTHYAHADEFDDPKWWYEACYKPWRYGEMAVFPRKGGGWTKYKVIKQPLPDELK